MSQVQPSTPSGPAAPGVVAGEPAPEGTDTYGLPGSPEPVSTPPESDGPGATETNFITPPCHKDSDCPDGRRCVGEARVAAPADAGAAPNAADAGLASDAGVIDLGHCEAADGG